MKLVLATVGAALVFATAAQAVTTVTVEAAGLVNTTRTGILAVENFDGQPTGNVTPVNSTFAGIGVAASFSATRILSADQYGGAGGIGNQVAVRDTGDLVIDFTGTPLDYFGVWASALDASNTVSFFKAGTLLSSTNLTAFTLGGDYAGNPGGVFAGQNASEKYAFFNFAVGGGYDRVVLSQNGGGGFELDNVTIGAAVPEPSTWAMLVIGFGIVGVTSRRRQRTVAA